METVERAKVVSLLEGAAARLEGRGWKRHMFGRPEGPNCTLGALRWEAYERGYITEKHKWGATCSVFKQPILSEAVAYLAFTIGGFTAGDVSSWNDGLCAGIAEVTDGLRKAAKLAAEAT